jgi:membrane dipeptidase
MSDGAPADVHATSLVLDAASFFCTRHDEALDASGVTSINVMVPWPPDEFEDALRRVETYYELLATESRFMHILHADEVAEAKRSGRIGLVFGTQNLKLIGDRLMRLESMQRLGFRYVQLTYNERNSIGDGCAEPTDAGLSRFGRAVVEALPDVGMVMDLTHAGHRTALEALRLAKAPAMISHANPRSLYDNPRNAHDDVIRALADTGGVIGCTLPSPFNWDGSDRLPTLANFVRAVEYVINLVGADHVAIGSDLVATPGAYPAGLSATLRKDLFAVSGAFYGRYGTDPSIRKVQGIASYREWPVLTASLLDHGFDVTTVQKILGENLLRVYRSVWA